MIHDFSITDLTPRPDYPSYWDAVLKRRIWVRGFRIYDATGARLLYVNYADDETGEVVRYDVRDGVWRINPFTKRVVEIRERRPAPLKVVPLKPGERYLD